MSGNGIGPPALLYELNTLAELVEELLEIERMLLKSGVVAVYMCFNDGHCSSYPLNCGDGDWLVLCSVAL